MIKKIHEKDIVECVNVIKESFITVADELGYTVDNAPRFTAFATTEDRLLYQLKNEHRPMFVYYDNEETVNMRLGNEMTDDIQIVEIGDRSKKALYTREILEKLPEWFGNKQALDEYVQKVKEIPYYAALDIKGKCIGLGFFL